MLLYYLNGYSYVFLNGILTEVMLHLPEIIFRDTYHGQKSKVIKEKKQLSDSLPLSFQNSILTDGWMVVDFLGPIFDFGFQIAIHDCSSPLAGLSSCLAPRPQTATKSEVWECRSA